MSPSAGSEKAANRRTGHTLGGGLGSNNNDFLHRIGHAGATVSALKMVISQPETELWAEDDLPRTFAIRTWTRQAKAVASPVD
jgi:hypothetical protein